ncbi:monocyte to macrophage differentiation factor 2 [Heteronotia binoei]|uniref:monocyte to macrophage differentiation factor 2 n=1 Tax=Heteronotia binoei TaxID=13085 RepID=UPI00292E896D|nr:monocyte to macrophage differentiation factor 2 [Heteronotia binoei]
MFVSRLLDFQKTRYARFMNHRVPSNRRYQPTDYEHAANCATHAVSGARFLLGERDGVQRGERGVGSPGYFLPNLSHCLASVYVSGHQPNTEGLLELLAGGIFYCLGTVFFKSDGRIPFAHAIWHLFVATGAGIHYYAIWRYLYQPDALEGKTST